MSAIKLFHGEVSEDLLMKEKQFEGLRTKLLAGRPLLWQARGIAQKPDRSEVAGGPGQGVLRAGELTGKIGNKPEALAVHLKGLAVRRTLAAEAGDDFPSATKAA